MAKAKRADTPAETRFLSAVGEAHETVDEIESTWKHIPSKSRNEMKRRIPCALASGNMDAHDLWLKFVSLDESRVKALFSTDMRRQVARQFIQRDPTHMATYDLAKSVWGQGSIPVDVLCTFIAVDRSIRDIRDYEIHDGNREELSMEIAKRHDFASLQRIYPKCIPERYVRVCLTEMKSRQLQESHEFEILHCNILLQKWDDVEFTLKHDSHQKLAKREAEIVMLLRGQPNKVLAIVAAWLADRGKLELLKTLYAKNPEHWGIPPKTFLKTCLQVNKELLPKGEAHQHDAAECSVLLKDWNEARRLLALCKHDAPIAYLLLHLYKNGQAIPKKRS